MRLNKENPGMRATNVYEAVWVKLAHFLHMKSK